MNCARGDLARVVAPGYMLRCSCGAQAVIVRPDTLVVCEQPFADGWMLRESLQVSAVLPCGGGYVTGRVSSLPDSLLRPIRDPGDDAIDEMVKLVGAAPMTLTEVLELHS